MTPIQPYVRVVRLMVAVLLGIQAGLLVLAPVDAAARTLAPADAALRINPNTATEAELRLLPQIGPKLAAYIIEYRESAAAQPAFGQAEDLDHVHRIGPATVERLRPLLCFPQDDHNASP